MSDAASAAVDTVPMSKAPMTVDVEQVKAKHHFLVFVVSFHLPSDKTGKKSYL